MMNSVDGVAQLAKMPAMNNPVLVNINVLIQSGEFSWTVHDFVKSFLFVGSNRVKSLTPCHRPLIMKPVHDNRSGGFMARFTSVVNVLEIFCV